MNPEGMSRTDITREAWLERAVTLLQPLYADTPAKPCSVRVSVGWPIVGGRPGKKQRVGECWVQGAEDKKPAIFISPVCADAFTALETLAHELIHAYLPPKTGHRGAFKVTALAVGFMPPMRSTPCSPELATKLHAIAKKLGAYPHAKINPGMRKKQPTRMIKCSCPACGYICRTVKKWLEEQGAPICPCNRKVMSADFEADEE